MNYYYPYYSFYPYMNTIEKPSLLSKLFGNIKSINYNSILSGTQKTLNIINQTIPLVKQVSPIMKNAKTMFKVMNEFKRINTPSNNKENVTKKETLYNDGPKFFV